MSRRFQVKDEASSIHEGLQKFGHEVGTTVLWYAFDREESAPEEGVDGPAVGDSIYDDVYDESSVTPGGGGATLQWKDPWIVNVLSAVRYEGAEQPNDTGFYTTDRLHLAIDRISAEQQGLLTVDLRSNDRLHDRVVYDNVVFGVTDIQVRGQLEDHDLVIGVDLAEVDPSELVNEPDFLNWASR